MTSSQLKQLNRQPDLGRVSIEYEMVCLTTNTTDDRSSKSIWTSHGQQIQVVSPYKLIHNLQGERQSILQVPHPPQDFCRTASVPESSMSPGSWDFPCVASIYQCGSSTYCHKSSRWVWRSPWVKFIPSCGLPQPFSCHSLDLRNLMPTGTAELTRDTDLTLLKNWIRG